MKLSLIREANTLANLGDRAAMAKQVQKILGIDSVSSLVETSGSDFEVTPQHYTQWLEVINDIARERGVSLRVRRNFNEIAFDVLDNDSFIDAIGGDTEQTKGSIVKSLWQAHQVNLAHEKVQSSVGKAREEEEASGFRQAFDVAYGVPPGDEDEELLRPEDLSPEPTVAIDGDDEIDQDPDSPEGLASRITDELGVSFDAYDDEGDEEPIEARVQDLEARVQDLEGDSAATPQPTLPEENEEWDDDDDYEVDDDVEARQEFRDRQRERSDRGWDDHPHGTYDRHQSRNLDDDWSVDEEDEEKAKSVFRQAITAPREQLSAALKDVEAEGAKAWAALQMPRNPHPKKSQAYNAWQRGFKRSARDVLGFADKARETTSKHHSKRK